MLKNPLRKGTEIDGKMYYKGSEPHKASVTGDTVGDPLKDTSGPSMNILIKLSSIVALVIAPMIALPTEPVEDIYEDKLGNNPGELHSSIEDSSDPEKLGHEETDKKEEYIDDGEETL